jgi:hypothetical protein
MELFLILKTALRMRELKKNDKRLLAGILAKRDAGIHPASNKLRSRSTGLALLVQKVLFSIQKSFISIMEKNLLQLSDPRTSV